MRVTHLKLAMIRLRDVGQLGLRNLVWIAASFPLSLLQAHGPAI